jgi:hypothetical protein
MDHNHKLEAPNEDELRDIEQIQTRSDASTVYRSPKKHYDGQIMSEEERVKAKAEELEALTGGLASSALKIGLLIPYPFVSGALIAAGAYSISESIPPIAFGAIAIIGALFWLLTSYNAYASIFKTFYNHAMRAGPFVSIMLVSTFIASQAIYGYVAHLFAGETLIFNVALNSLLVVIYSMLTTFVLLGIWSNSRLGDLTRVVSALGIIAISSFMVVGLNLL